MSGTLALWVSDTLRAHWINARSGIRSHPAKTNIYKEPGVRRVRNVIRVVLGQPGRQQHLTKRSPNTQSAMSLGHFPQHSRICPEGVYLKTMVQKANDRWSVVDTVAQLTLEDVVISFQRAVGAARLRKLWNVPCRSMDSPGKTPTGVLIEG